MELYQILCLVGFPTIFLGAIAVIHEKFKVVKTEIKAIKLGIQALLRARMISDYNKWIKAGYAPIYAKENFENCWVQYETLGENGVMQTLHDEFMDLPTQ